MEVVIAICVALVVAAAIIAIWSIDARLGVAELRDRSLAEHLKDVIIRLSALEGKSESGTVKSRLDNLTNRVEQLEKGEE